MRDKYKNKNSDGESSNEQVNAFNYFDYQV